MSRRRRFRTTRATAATVARWATGGKARVRAKYCNAVTACRVIHRREMPLLAEDAAGAFGVVESVKMSFGYGHVRRRRDEFWIGWYGDWHVRYIGRSLDCLAHLRAWVRDGMPGRVVQASAVRRADSYAESLRALRKR